jgi:3-oxoacyl-[acyl-carrier protein] reductase
MDLQLTGKVALVTGASAGLGRTIAAMPAAEGCRLAILARRRPLVAARKWHS